VLSYLDPNSKSRALARPGRTLSTPSRLSTTPLPLACEACDRGASDVPTVVYQTHRARFRRLLFAYTGLQPIALHPGRYVGNDRVNQTGLSVYTYNWIGLD
jgi:hypothetical protein